MTISVAAEINSEGANRGAAVFRQALSSMRSGIVDTIKSLEGFASAQAAAATASASAARGLANNITTTRLAAGGFAVLATAVAAVSTAMAVKSVSAAVAASDAYLKLENQLRAVVDEGERVQPIFAELQSLADRTRAPLAGVVSLYAEQVETFAEYGIRGEQANRVTETLARTMALSGKEVGALGGEIKGLAVSSPEVMRVLAAETGKTREELRKLAGEGRITNETILVALQNAGGQIDQRFAAMGKTAESAAARVRTTFAQAFNDAARENKLSETFAELFNQLNRLAGSTVVRNFADGTAGSVRMIGDVLNGLATAIDETVLSFRTLARVLTPSATGSQADAPGWWQRLRSSVSDTASGILESAKATFPEAARMVQFYIDAHKELAKVVTDQRAITALRDTLDPAAASRGVNFAARREVPFGEKQGADYARDSLQKQIEIQRQQREIILAETQGDGARVEALRSQLELRQRISDTMRREHPELVAVLETEIKRTQEAARMQEAQRTGREIENERLENAKTIAQIGGDRATVQNLETELAVRRGVTEELRLQFPELAKQREINIRISQDLQRQAREREVLNQQGTQFAQTVFDGFVNGVREGQKFSQMLRSIGARLAEMVVQFTVLKPLAESLGNSFGSIFSSSASSAATTAATGAATSAATSAGASGLGSLFSGFAFADGGVFDRPVGLAGAGWSGVMAEAGPEAIMPLRRTASGQLGVVAAGGGSAGPANITINVAGDATEETVAKLRAVAREELSRATPGIVRDSVDAVADNYQRDARYLRR